MRPSSSSGSPHSESRNFYSTILASAYPGPVGNLFREHLARARCASSDGYDHVFQSPDRPQLKRPGRAGARPMVAGTVSARTATMPRPMATMSSNPSGTTSTRNEDNVTPRPPCGGSTGEP